MLDAVVQPQRHHLAIAGTGRAGTTFLVRYLTEIGLDTHLSRHVKAEMDCYANAGFEDAPLSMDAAELPYVIKSPWLHEYLDDLLRDAHLDAVIIPVRDLSAVASSRTLVELDAMHRAAPWLVEHQGAWDTWGWSPGGAVFSLDPLDQARLLAVGFHRLIERLVYAEVPIILLSFPRVVLDAVYLHRKLATLMPQGTTEQAALAAHARVADTGKIRVDVELTGLVYARPDRRDLDVLAVRRQLLRLRAEVEAMRASRSWKLTIPLRQMNTWLKRLRSRPGTNLIQRRMQPRNLITVTISH